MAKSYKKKWHYDDEDVEFKKDKKSLRRDRERRQMKKLKNALRAKNIDEMIVDND